MATPYFYAYPTIGGLMMGSRAIECFEYSDLTRDADKRGDDLTIEHLPGREPKGRLDDDSRRIVEVRLDGAYSQDNVPTTPTREARITAYYGHLEALRTVAAVNGPQTIVLTVGSDEWEGTCTVERTGKPTRLNPWAYELALDLTVHGGKLTKVAA